MESTARFYTSENYGSLYKGFLKFDMINLKAFESWLLSGNILKVGKNTIETAEEIKLQIIFKEMEELGV